LSTNVTVNGIPFLKEHMGEGAAGSSYVQTSYTTVKNGNCITLDLVLQSFNDKWIPTYDNPNAKPFTQYDYDKEAAVMDQILSSLRFTR
jgi:hypothetical protein